MFSIILFVLLPFFNSKFPDPNRGSNPGLLRHLSNIGCVNSIVNRPNDYVPPILWWTDSITPYVGKVYFYIYPSKLILTIKPHFRHFMQYIIGLILITPLMISTNYIFTQYILFFCLSSSFLISNQLMELTKLILKA